MDKQVKTMSKYYFPQIDNLNFASMPRREGAGVYHTPSLSNKGSEQNLITRTGGATLADFVVAILRRRVYAFSQASRNQLQGRSLQLVESSI